MGVFAVPRLVYQKLGGKVETSRLVSFMAVAHVISYFGVDIVRNPGTRLTYLPLPHGESIGPLSS